MKNIIGTPVTSRLNGALTPAGGGEAIPWEDTKRLSPPPSSDYPLHSREEDSWVEKARALPSWRKAKKDGLIVMNPYRKGKITTEHFAGRINHTSYYYGIAGRYSVDCSKGVLSSDFKYHDMQMPYTEQGDWFYWKDVRKVPNYPVEIDFSSNTEHVKTALLAKLNTSYDLLTELAEGKESIRTIASLIKALAHPIRAFKEERDRLYKSFHRGEIKTYSHLLKRLADAWMTYRYGISPIVYSIQDILKTIKLKDAVFHTERAGDDVDVKDFESSPIIKPSLYLHDTISGSIRIRAVGKDGYSVNTSLQLSDLIGFNPLVTAWEKVPYSFVIDWAINVSDFLNAALGTLLSAADQRVCCYSIRSDYTIESRLHWDYKSTYHTFAPELWECGNTIQVHPGWNINRSSQESGSVLVKTVKVNTYERVIFNEGDISLAFNLSLNWKRILDSLALTLNQSRKHISSLR